jgi:hypothetical protein
MTGLPHTYAPTTPPLSNEIDMVRIWFTLFKAAAMTKEEFLQSKLFRVLLPLFAVAITVGLVKNGYLFGQWLHRVLH